MGETWDELHRYIAKLEDQLAAAEADNHRLRAALGDDEKLKAQLTSCFAWAKAARTKGSGLPPSRALRWIDEMGDRTALRASGDGQQ